MLLLSTLDVSQSCKSLQKWSYSSPGSSEADPEAPPSMLADPRCQWSRVHISSSCAQALPREHFWNWGRLCMKPHFQTETMKKKKKGGSVWFFLLKTRWTFVVQQVLTWRQRGLAVCGWVSFQLSCSIWFYFPDLKSWGQRRVEHE